MREHPATLQFSCSSESGLHIPHIEVHSFLENVVWAFSNIWLMQILLETNKLLSENQLFEN